MGYQQLLTAASSAPRTHRTTAALKLRKGAGRHYVVQQHLNEGAELSVVQVAGSWAHVAYRGTYGWVPNAYLEPIPAVFDEPVAGNDEESAGPKVLTRYSTVESTHVTTATLNLRKGSGTGYPVMKVLDEGTKVRVVHVQGLWSQIHSGNLSGWVPGMYLQELPSQPAAGSLIAVPNQRALTTIRLNARRGPGDHYSLARILQADTAVHIVARQGAWRKIERDGDEMWIPASQLRTVY